MTFRPESNLILFLEHTVLHQRNWKSTKKQVFNDGMMDIDAYGPFPNAILFNWATIFVLGFGNLAALDFQVK